MLLDEDEIFEDISEVSEDNPEELTFSEDDDIAAIDIITDDDVDDDDEVPLDNLDDGEGDKDDIHT